MRGWDFFSKEEEARDLKVAPTHPLGPWLKVPRLHEALPYEAYDPKTQLFFNKESTGFVLLASPLAGASLADQGHLAHFFRQKENLPEGAALQFLLYASPRIGGQIQRWEEVRQGIYRELAQRRTDFLKEKIFRDETGNSLREYRLFISYTLPGPIQNPVAQESLLELRKNLMGVLGLIGLPSRILKAQDLLKELGEIFNQGEDIFPQKVFWNPYESLSKQILAPNRTFCIQEGFVECSGHRILKSYVPKHTPPLWALPHMDRFLGEGLKQGQSLPCPFLLHYGFFVEDGQGKAHKKLIAKRTALENALKNRLTKWMTGLEEEYKEVSACWEEVQKGERFIASLLSVCLVSSKESLALHEGKLKYIWSEAGWEIMPATFDHLPIFLASLPMTWTGQEAKRFAKSFKGYGPDLLKMGRAQRTITREAQNLLPILAEWKGQEAPGMLLYGRRGQLFFWNPFGNAFLPNSPNSTTDSNYNVCISGTSGSGKSVFMQELMVTTLGVGGKVFVLDYGRSFKKACQLLKGQYIEFDLRAPISLNPFSEIPEGLDQEAVEKRNDLLGTLKPILQVMAAPKLGTNDLQNADLDRAIQSVWKEKGAKSTLDDIQAFLLKRGTQSAMDLGNMLYPFASSGSYGAFFKGKAQARLSDDLVVIETDHLQNHPNLMAVLVQMMILHINQEMARGDRTRPFLIMIDEAWKLLQGKDSAAFIAQATRVSRKYKGSIVLGTQNLTDYFNEESPAATAAFNNSEWKGMLYQNADVIESLKSHDQLKRFVSSGYREELLRSVASHTPHYSEIALYGGGVQGVIGRLSLDPFSRILYSTNPEEFQAVQNLTNKGISVFEAICEVLKGESPLRERLSHGT